MARRKETACPRDQWERLLKLTGNRTLASLVALLALVALAIAMLPVAWLRETEE